MATGPTSERGVRRRRPRTPAGIPYATVEAVAADLHGIGNDGLVALRARLHSLRRLDFPNGVSGSSGRHFAYGLADLVAILAALELAEGYVPPAAAAAIVREGWPEIARCALAGIADPVEPGVAIVHPNALFQALAHAGGRTSDTLHVEVAALAHPAPATRTIDIAAGSTARRMLQALKRLDPRSAELAHAQLPDLDAAFGGGDPLPRKAANDGRLLSDGPYWSRAQSLVTALADGVPAEGERRRLAWQLGYLSRPAPVDAWKTRVEVHPDNPDVGYAAALASLAHEAGLRSARVPLSGDDAKRNLRALLGTFGDQPAIAARLSQIAETGERMVAAGASAGR